jgi:hypothetical protein
MNTKCAVRVISCLLAMGSACLGEPPNHGHLTGLLAKHEKPIEDLRTQLAGTNWKAVPAEPLRGGLAPILTFTAAAVAPAGYRYEAASSDAVTIYFSHGDTQVMKLSPDGRHLQFNFQQHDFAYELLEKDQKPGLDLGTELAGTAWRALPIHHLRPGLAATLTFTKETVAPAGYAYGVNSPDSITIHFNHGDTQLMLLETDGRRLKFVFKGQDYEYELVRK